MIVATVILIVVYLFIITEKINRAIISLLGAGLLVLLGVLNFNLVVHGIDFNTIFLLIGMMVIVAITKESGIFQFVAIYAAKLVKANPRLLLIVLALVTAVFSMLLDNVTTVLLIVPVTLLLTDQLKQRAYPFLFAQIFASNIGGTATLIGDPPNILIGSAVGLSFMDFVVALSPIVIFVLAMCLFIFDFIWGRHMVAAEEDKRAMMEFNAFDAISDKGLLFKSLFTLALVLFGFIYGHGQGWEPGTIALTGAAFLMLLQSVGKKPEDQTHAVQHALQQVEWETIFFFIGLFVLVSGVEHTGLLSIIAAKLLGITGTDVPFAGMIVLFASAILSAIVDNIPFVATMIPLLKAMQTDLGGPDAIAPLWWCLSLGACLGGNGTLIGASANVMVSSFAERAGQRIPFVQFLKLSFPLMLLTVMVSGVYAYFVYF